MKSISRKISYLLRHDPEDLIIDNNGWVDITDLINKLNISFNQLKEIVNTNDKKRFSFNKDLTKIRANQGHSIDIDVELIKKIPPKFLFHGTSLSNIKKIKRNGILKMNRNHVHLSLDSNTALNVAKRHAKNNETFIFKIDTFPMIIDNINFYLSANNVWLVDYIDPKYLKYDKNN